MIDIAERDVGFRFRLNVFRHNIAQSVQRVGIVRREFQARGARTR